MTTGLISKSNMSCLEDRPGNDSMQHYTLKDGLLQSAPVGGNTWNPLKNGVTTLLLRQFNRYRSFEFENDDKAATVHPVQRLES